MSALTDEQRLPVNPTPDEPTSTQEPAPGVEGTSAPELPLAERIKSDPALQSEWDRQVAANAAARFEADRRAHEQQRLAEARKADDERWQRLSVQRALAREGRADPPSDEDEEWFNSHGTTRAQVEVFNQWATDYDGARVKNPKIPDFREYVGQPTHVLIEAIYQAGHRDGRDSREPEIETEAKKRAAALSSEGLSHNREITRTDRDAGVTSPGGGRGSYATEKEVYDAIGNKEITPQQGLAAIARLGAGR